MNKITIYCLALVTEQLNYFVAYIIYIKIKTHGSELQGQGGSTL